MNDLRGEIDVERMMELIARQKRITEWYALKDYWKACREHDEVSKRKLLALYGDTLVKALAKYNQRFKR
jgi:hypothetical protein